jgi:hypothetical protein
MPTARRLGLQCRQFVARANDYHRHFDKPSATAGGGATDAKADEEGVET